MKVYFIILRSLEPISHRPHHPSLSRPLWYQARKRGRYDIFANHIAVDRFGRGLWID